MISDVYKNCFRAIFIALLCITSFYTFASSPLEVKKGPKVRVAVAKFGATDRFASVYGGWDVGGGLAAQLVTALIDTGRVVVVERATLSKVLIEQELGQSKLSSPFTQTPSGQLLGVDYLIVGEVTEFEERQMGAGGGFALMKSFGPKVSGEVTAAHVGMDLRVIDTRTGEILYSYRSKGRAWEKAAGFKVNYKVIDFGGDMFHKTPLGKATRRAIEDATEFILNILDERNKNFDWLARVIEVEGPNIYFDAGLDAHVQLGDTFSIKTVQKVLTDPETNEIIGLVENSQGYAKAVEVAPKYTKATFIGGGRPTVGALVRFATGKEKSVGGKDAETTVGYDLLE